MALREVLFVVYYFPPLGMGGVQRPLKFVKYLPGFCWRPIVLTVKPVRYYASDASLLGEIPEEARVLRASSLDPLRVTELLGGMVKSGFGQAHSRFKPFVDWLAVPDLSLGWLPFAVTAGLAAIRIHPIEVILATAPPYTSHLVGAILSKITGCPLVLDYRDAWTHRSSRSFPTRAHLLLNRWLEGQSLRAARRVVAVNESIAQGLRATLPLGEQAKVSSLPLGYDPEDFEGDPVSMPSKFRISHVGSLIGERSPKALLEGLKHLLDSHPELRNDIEIRFVGHHRLKDELMIRDSGLSDVVTCQPYRPHRESVAELLSAHVLYLVIGAGESETISTGKLFEYLGARKPILASAPACEAVRTIKEAAAGSAFHPEDSKGLAEEIFRLYALHRQGRLTGPTLEAVRRYDRRELTSELARHLSEVA